MKTLTTFSILLSLLFGTSIGLAHGTRGGGETVKGADGKYYLRDLVDKAVCDLTNGEDMRKTNPALNAALDKIADLDWYFAASLKYEINKLEICMTEDLIQLSTEDADSVIKSKPTNKKVTAIRLLGTNKVYIDRDIYNEIGKTEADTQHHQAFLIVHEAMHSFIPTWASLRNESLRGAVKTLEKVVKGKIATRRLLHRELTQHQVSFPFNSPILKNTRISVEFALASFDDQRSIFLKAESTGGVDNLKIECTDGAYSDNAHELSKNLSARISDLLEESGTDLAILNAVVNSQQPVLTFDPLMVALSTTLAAENAKYQDMILNSKAMKNGPTIFQKMKSKDLTVGKFRIVGNDGYQLLGITKSQELPVPALSVLPYSVQEIKWIPTEIKGLLNFLEIYLKRGDFGWSLIQKLVSQNDNFYAAFGVQDLQAKLDSMQAVPVPREKEALVNALPELSRGFRAILYYHMETYVSPAAAQKLDQEINWSRFVLPQN